VTPERAQEAYDDARRKFGDVCLNPDATERDYDRAKEVLNQAERVVRGMPHGLSGAYRRPA
jgi:hypothetical protein